MDMAKVLVADPLHKTGQDLLQQEAEIVIATGLSEDELISQIGIYDGLVVRSETQVTKAVLQAGTKLKVVARAGVGVDNINLEAATDLGIAVVNAPTGNTVAAAEHTVALLLALVRNIPQSYQSLRAKEWRRSQFIGVEVRHKILGVAGLGKVGTLVARRAKGLEMKVIGYDPFVSQEYANRLGVDLVSKEELLSQADFITLHLPFTPTTENFLDAASLRLVKNSVRILNVARGGLVDDAALFAALEDDRVAGAGLDVFQSEPPLDYTLINHPRVIATPHLGASTEEAQEEVAREAVTQLMMVLRGDPAPYTVNASFSPPQPEGILHAYVGLASLIGKLAVQLSEGQLNGVTVRYQGDIALEDTSILKASSLVGVLEEVSSEKVNLVNAHLVAERRGLRILEEKVSGDSENYGNLITTEIHTNSGSMTVIGTMLRNQPRIVGIDGYWIDLDPSNKYLLVTRHQDQPGLIGAVGTVVGEGGINISFMEVSRQAPRGQAMMIIGLDDKLDKDALDKIRGIPFIDEVSLVTL
jgi:D-3-phosphoglycerate dehydrogenase